MSRITRRTIVPVNQITPLTYRDGVTYIQMLSQLSEYVKGVLHPSLQHTVDQIVADVETQMDKHHDQYVAGVQEFQRIHDAFMSDVNAHLIALNDTALTDLVNDETSAVGDTLRDMFVHQDRVPLNVKDYGVTGDGRTDDTDAFQAVLNLAEEQDRVVYMPAGDYRFRPDEIVLRQYHRIVGDGLDKTIIRPVGENRVGVGFEMVAYNNLTGLYFRDWQEGVKATNHTSKIHQCRFSYNTVGVHFERDAYIFSFFENTVTYNRSIGLLVGQQAYQLNIVQNIIDNNNGLGIGIYGSSTGLVIRDNTIEGNRKFSDSSEFGCGVLIRGLFSRLTIEGNWFEINGRTPDSSDIFFIGGPSLTEYRDISNRFIRDVIDPAYRELFNGETTVGQFTIRNNRFYATDNSIVVSHQSPTSYSIEDNAFFATKSSHDPRHIVLNVPEYGMSNGVSTRQIIDRNQYTTQNHPVNQHYNNTIVYVPEPPQNPWNRSGVLYNGSPLFHGSHIEYGNTFTDITRANNDTEYDARLRIRNNGSIEVRVRDQIIASFGRYDFPQPCFLEGIALSPNGVTIQSGSSDPNGSVTAIPGSLYLRWGSNPGMWFKQSGAGNTGWVEK